MTASYYKILALGVTVLVSVRGDDNGLAMKTYIPRLKELGMQIIADRNFLQCNVNQTVMVSSYQAMVKKRDVGGVLMSLLDLGYTDAGLDDCWQGCHQIDPSYPEFYGPSNWTFHDQSGSPVVNIHRFPNMYEMVEAAHSLGLKAGFYTNNCKCRDTCDDDACFIQDVKATVAWGFDSIKLDGCSAQKDPVKWRTLFNQTSPRPVLIENCHNGHKNVPGVWNQTQIPWGKDAASCPFNMYRSSADIGPSWGNILNNVYSVFPLAEQGLSYPGCWAYPDMLEIGDDNSRGGKFPLLTWTESRSHFGLWSIVSSPLILSFNIISEDIMASMWPIISNTEVIAVNQRWDGFSGSAFYTSAENITFSPCTSWVESCPFAAVMYLYKPQPRHSAAVLLLNNYPTDFDLTFTFADVPTFSKNHPDTRYRVRDIWASIDLGVYRHNFIATGVASHDNVYLMIVPAEGNHHHHSGSTTVAEAGVLESR